MISQEIRKVQLKIKSAGSWAVNLQWD